MGKYVYELKLEIVRENLDGFGYKYLANKYSIPSNTIENWCEQYKIYGEEGIEKSMSKTKYTSVFKLSVLKYRQINKLSYRETAEHFGIKNKSTIANWQRTYDEKGFAGLNGSIGRPKKTGEINMTEDKKPIPKIEKLSKSEREELIELREKTKYLEAENLYLKKLDALIREKKSQTKKKQK